MPPKIPSVLAIANEGGAVLIGVSDTAGAYRSVIGGPDHKLWLTPRRDLCQDVCLELALRDGRHFDGQPSLSGHCGHGWTCSLPGPVAIDTRQPQDGTSKRACTGPGSARSFISSRLPALILIAAPFSSRLSRYKTICWSAITSYCEGFPVGCSSRSVMAPTAHRGAAAEWTSVCRSRAAGASSGPQAAARAGQEETRWRPPGRQRKLT